MKRFDNYAEETAERIFATLGVTPTPAQRAATIEMIEEQLVDNAVETRKWCVDHATQSRKSGRQLADELKSAHEALLANLSSMR